MKKIVIMLALIGISSMTTFAYNTQGFAEFTELVNGIRLSCSGQCLVFLGEKLSNDMLRVNNIKGQGQIVVGALDQTNQFFPIQQQTVNTVDYQNHQFMIDYGRMGRISKNTPIVVAFVGDFQADTMTMYFKKMTLWEKIGSIWDSFWGNETLMPYSINLRYGIKLLGVSIVRIGYVIFVIGVLYLLIDSRFNKQRTKLIFYRGCSLVIFLGLRNTINRIDRTKTGLDSYTFAMSDQKSFFDLGDYITFSKKMREVLKLDKKFAHGDCRVISYGQSRPFVAHLDMVYIKPCEPTIDKSLADYIIYYHQEVSADDANKTKLLEFNGSTVIQNK